MSTKWPMVKLGEVLSQYPEYIDAPEPREYSKLSVKLYGRGVVLDTPANGATLKMMRHQIAKAGQVILSEIWGKKGAIGFVPDEGEGALCTSHFFLFDIANDKLDRRWLQAIFDANYLEAQLDADAKGTTGYAAVRPKTLLGCEIPLPPLPEQRRIVVRIEELAAKINEARGLRQKATAEAKAVEFAPARQRLCSLRLEPTHLSEWLDPKRDGIQTGPFGAELSRHEFTASGRPLLTVGNIQYGGLDTKGLKFVSETKAQELSRYEVMPGDILFARMGTVGRCSVVPVEASGWLINYHIIRVAPDQQRVDSRFIHWTIQASRDVEEYLENKIRGATREGVNSKIVAQLPCRVPSLPEQRRIVSELDALQSQVAKLKKVQAQTSAEIDAMLPSILDRAFNGKL